MAEISKQALKVENNSSFPNNNSGYITPALLRTFNVDMIDSLVDEQTYNQDSASWNVSIDNIEAFTASLFTSSSLALTTASVSGQTLTFRKGDGTTFGVVLPAGSGSGATITVQDEGTILGNVTSFNFNGAGVTATLNAGTASITIPGGGGTVDTGSLVTTSSFNAYTSSNNQRVSSLEVNSASVNTSITQLNASSASQQVSINALNVFTASQSTASLVTSINNLNTFSASALTSLSNLNTTTASLNNSVTQLNASSASQQVSINNLNTTTASLNTSASLALVTASFNNGTRNLTFTKGDTTQFSVNIPDVSGSAGNFVTTASFNSYTQSNDQRVSSLESNSASVNTSVTNLNSATSSLFTSASLGLTSASINGVNLTFAKGDGTNFTLQLNTGSVASASYADTASYSQFAQDIYLNVKNTTGAQINKGTIVRIIGATGDNALIATASWTNDSSSANTLGILYENIADQSFGKVITQGTLLGINTDPTLGYAAGQLLYLSSSGQYTNVKPPAPYHEVRLGQVLRAQQNNGSMYVLIQNGYELEELHDVDINTGSLANNNLLAYNSASGQWENKTVTEVGATTTASFNAYTQSTDGRLTNIESTTASLNTSVSNLNSFSASTLVSISNLNGFSASTLTRLTNIETTTASLLIETTNLELFTSSQFVSNSYFATTGSNTFRGTQNISGSIIFPNGTEVRGNASQQSLFYSPTNALLVGSGVNMTITSSNLVLESPRTDVRGVETIGDITTGTSVGEVYLLGRSGSFILSNATSVPTYASLSHLSSSQVNANTNLIFKSNTNTADTIISGSDNIFSNPAAVTAGLKRYIGGNNNIINTTSTPQISGSMQFSPVMTSNIINAQFNMRGPVSSSTYTITNNNFVGTVNLGSSAVLHAQGLAAGLLMNQNQVAGGLNVFANQSVHTGSATTITSNIVNGSLSLILSSSAVSAVNNTVNDAGFVFNNQFSSQSVGLGRPTLTSNTIGGSGNTFLLTGSQVGAGGAPTFGQNLVIGTSNTLFVNASTARIDGANIYHNAFATNILGQRLIVSGSSNLTDANSYGSTFLGRWNADDAVRNTTANVVLAVGTGTSTTRKTGFLIDSGSNTFVEGTLNVSGATSLNGNLNITGSLTASLQQGYVWVGNASGITTTVSTSSFGGGGGATFPYTGTASISGSLQVTGSLSTLPITLSVSANTASLNMLDGNNFVLTLPSSSTTHITATNIVPGQTLNLLVKQQVGPATGSITFAPFILFPSGLDMQATSTGSAIDLVSMLSFDTTNLMAANVKNLR